ncbi:MAG: T9SS type A sorting domain-containing protein [Ignavibacteriales bacterium]
MKALTATLLVILLLVLSGVTGNIYAANDTLVVYAKSAQTLDKIISSDVTGTGAQAHKVYKLVSTDTTYIFDAAITATSDINIIGVPGKNGRPPCIQPDVLSDGTVPASFLILNAAGIKASLQNLYIIGQSIAGSVNSPNAIGVVVRGDKVRLFVNNVIFEQWDQFAIQYTGDMDKFFIYNCKFRNMVNSAGQWYVGEALRNSGGNATDSVVMKYNTMFCVNAYAAAPVTGKILTYFDFSHNSVVWSFKNPFFIFNATTAKINDNLFYGSWSGGISKTEYPWWDQLRSPEYGSIIDMDTCNLAIAKIFNPQDSTNANARMLAEAKRKVEVKNNAYFWPKKLVDFVKAWNDTAHVDSIITATWMNQRTTKMFTDKTTWPGFTESGNKNVDPVFGASIDKVMDENVGNGVGLLKYFKAVRTATVSSEVWGYKLQNVSGSNWIPEWPLPEATDLKYTNTTLMAGATDGKPVGDPYWFTGLTPTGVKENYKATVPGSFTLYEAYPNPFNPSTTIRFDLPENGNISLKIYDIQGRLVQTVVDNSFKVRGTYEYKVNMNKLSSGIYMYTLQQNGRVQTKKMALLK